MIAYIKGKIVEKNPAYVVLETNSGVAYHLNISLHTYSSLPEGESCMLHTYFYVKEDAQTLYGFVEKNEKILFTQLISVSGIGPTTAQLMLSSLNPQEIQQAIIQENETLIKSMKGIGPKTAKRVILELRDKLMKIDLGGGQTKLQTSVAQSTYKEEALNALLALGIAKHNAQKAIARVLRQDAEVKSVEELIKKALNMI